MHGVSPEVLAALGGSILYDEHRGDLGRAKRAAQDQLDRALAAADPLAQADAWLAKGMTHLLAGEPLAAGACWERVRELASGDPARRLLAFCGSALVERLRFQGFPGGAAGTTLEIEARWDRAGAGKREQEEHAALRGQVEEPEALFAAAVLFDLLRDLPAMRLILSGQYLRQPAEAAALADRIFGQVHAFRHRMETVAPPGLLAYLDRQLADLRWRASRSQEALRQLREAHDLYTREDDAVGMAGCCLTLGDWLCAPATSPLIWNHFVQEGAVDSVLPPPREKAELDRSAIQVEPAAQAYAAAGELFRAAGALRGLAELELRWGYLRMLVDDYEGVVEHAGRAEDLFAGQEDLLGVWTARAHRLLGEIGAPARRADAAVAEAIGAWGAGEGSFSFASGLGLLFLRVGRRWLLREGDYERALLCQRLGRSLFERLGARENATQGLLDEGGAYRMAGEHDAALDLFEAARERYAAQLTEPSPIATALWQKAIMSADKAHEAWMGRKDPRGIAHSHERLQAVYALRPAPDGSDLFGSSFQDSLDGLLKFRAEMSAILVPLYRAVEATDNGFPEKAQPDFERAWSAARAAVVADQDLLSASVLRLWRRHSEAEKFLQRYLDKGGAASGYLGDLTGRVAQHFGEAGLALSEHRIGNTHRFAAEFFLRAQVFEKARFHLRAVESCAGPDWWRDSPRPWETRELYGETAEGLGSYVQALEHYDDAITLLEARRGLLTRDDLRLSVAAETGSRFLYFRAARTALKLHQQARDGGEDAQAGAWAERAFHYAERGKARALLDLLATGAVEGAAGERTEALARRLVAQLSVHRRLLADERVRSEADSGRIEWLTRRIAEDETELNRLETDLAARLGNFPQGAPLALERVRELLPSDAALLLYYFLGDDLMIWGIPSRGPVQVCRKELDTRLMSRRMRDLRRACQLGQSYRKLGMELSSLLLAPLSGILDAHRRLIVVPYGDAHTLPFHVLPWRANPLGTTHILSYLPSASTLQFLSPWPAAVPQRVLAVGDPVGMAEPVIPGEPSRTLAPLAGAAAEASAVARSFPKGEALLGEQATLQAVRERMAGRDVLHFATHGYLSSEAPLRSAILLANGEALTVYELMGERIEARLVVLSACESGLGRKTGGDDVLGLARGVLAAGANAAIVSLWRVNDAATLPLMRELYRRLCAGEPPAEALHGAQAYLRDLSGNNYEHPYYWAPFILIGRG